MTVILYARQSLDRDGKEAAVTRQLAESRAYAAAHGLIVDLELVDNDVSATSGIRRPSFERMLELKPTAIIAWHQDRLLRLGRDLERVIALDIPVHTVMSGTLDLVTPAGRAVARTLAAWSQYEGEQKSERQKASNRQRAEAGVWQFSRRPYGYERVNGTVQIVEHEAAIIREAFARYLAGETYYAIAEDLNERQVPTLGGGAWTITQLRERLKNPAYAGIRTYKGEVTAEGDWEPIIDRATWERFTATKRRRTTDHGWSNKTKYLLSGLALCGLCGGQMFARPEYGRKQPDGTKPVRMSYSCTSCWGVSRNLEKVDALVEAEVIDRLSQPDALALVMPKVDVTPLVLESQDLRARRDDLASLLADGTLTAAAVRQQSAKLLERLEELQQQIAASEGGGDISNLVLAESVADHWHHKLTFRQKRSIIEAGLTITINKQSSTRVFDPEAVVRKWVGSTPKGQCHYDRGGLEYPTDQQIRPCTTSQRHPRITSEHHRK